MAKRSRKIKKPYWQTIPCPSWCMGGHKKSDSDTDRTHMSRWEKRIVMTTMDTVVHIFENPTKIYFTRPRATLYLDQGYREISPRVILSDHEGHNEYKLTLDEAQEMAQALLRAVRLAQS